MPKKRYRNRIPKPGELISFYGKLKYDKPDIIYAWGDGIPRCDGSLLHYFFTGKTFDNKSLIEELEARGYDIETFQFSIKLKTPEK